MANNEELENKLKQVLKQIDSIVQESSPNEKKVVYLSNEEMIETIHEQVMKYNNLPCSKIDTINIINETITTAKEKNGIGFGREHSITSYSDRDIRNLFDNFAKQLECEDAKKVNEACEKIIGNRAILVNTLLKTVPNGSYNDILIGTLEEAKATADIKKLLNNKDCKVYCNYRHKTDNSVSGASSENDLLIVSKKGITSIEIKSSNFASVDISSTGSFTYTGTKFDGNPVIQAVQHKIALVSLLDSEVEGIENKVKAILYLPCCKEIKNEYVGISAYNSATLLVNELITSDNVLSEDEVKKINDKLEENKLDSIRFAHTMEYDNYYGTLVKLISKINGLKPILEKLTVELKEKNEKEGNRTDKIAKSVVILFNVIIAGILSTFIYYKYFFSSFENLEPYSTFLQYFGEKIWRFIYIIIGGYVASVVIMPLNYYICGLIDKRKNEIVNSLTPKVTIITAVVVYIAFYFVIQSVIG